MVKFCFALVALFVVAAQAFPAPYPDVMGYTSRTVYNPGMEHPVQTYRVDYAMPMETNAYYGSFYPQQMPALPAAHSRQRRQLGFGGMGGGMGGGMAGASASAQSQSVGSGMGMGLGGMGMSPYMMGMPFLG